jgi:hypothetical protein
MTIKGDLHHRQRHTSACALDQDGTLLIRDACLQPSAGAAAGDATAPLPLSHQTAAACGYRAGMTTASGAAEPQRAQQQLAAPRLYF